MALPDAPPARSVDVQRWRRLGKDRAYVRVDGRDVGFRDLRTGVAECTAVHQLETLMDVTDALVHLGVEPTPLRPSA